VSAYSSASADAGVETAAVVCAGWAAAAVEEVLDCSFVAAGGGPVGTPASVAPAPAKAQWLPRGPADC